MRYRLILTVTLQLEARKHKAARMDFMSEPSKAVEKPKLPTYLPYDDSFPKRAAAIEDGKVYLYVLLLNFSGKSKTLSHAYYVGQTTNLRKRLSQHSQLNWHQERFGEPAYAILAGTVLKEKADNAQTDLIIRLSQAGEKLNNRSPITGKPTKGFISDYEAKHFYDGSKFQPELIESWRHAWQMKSPEKASIAQSLQYVTKEDVLSYINSLPASRPREETLLMKILAEKLNVHGNESVISFQYPRPQSSSQKQLFRSQKNGRKRAQWDKRVAGWRAKGYSDADVERERVRELLDAVNDMWVLSTKLAVNTSLSFSLTRRSIAAILRHKSKMTGQAYPLP